MKIEILPYKSVLYDKLFEYIDSEVFNVKNVYPLFTFTIRFSELTEGEVLKIYINDQEVQSVVVSGTEYEYSFTPESDDTYLKVYGEGTESGRSDTIFVNLANYAIFIWVYAEQLTDILQNFAQSKQDFLIRSVVGDNYSVWKTGRNSYSLSKAVYDDIVVPIKDFLSADELKDVYFKQKYYWQRNSCVINLLLLQELFSPYVEQVMWIPFDEFRISSIGENVISSYDSATGTWTLNQNREYQYYFKRFIGTNPTQLVIDTAQDFTYIIASFDDNSSKKNGDALNVSAILAADLHNYFSFDTASLMAYVVNEEADGLLYIPAFVQEYGAQSAFSSGIRPHTRGFVNLSEAHHSVGDSVSLDVNYMYKRPLILATLWPMNIQGPLTWEASFMGSHYIYSNGGWDDGVVLIKFSDTVLNDEDLYNMLVKIIRYYWYRSRPVYKKLSLGFGYFSPDTPSIFPGYYFDAEYPEVWGGE